MKFRFCPICSTSLEPFEHEGIQRLRCSNNDCSFVHWDNPTPVVAAIVEHQGDVVLARNKAWPGEWFGLITGFLEKGEGPEAGVLREVEEELGLAGEVVEFVGHYDFVQMNQLLIAYHVRADGEIVLGEELAEYKRVSPARLRPWPMGTGHAVRDWLIRNHARTDLIEDGHA